MCPRGAAGLGAWGAWFWASYNALFWHVPRKKVVFFFSSLIYFFPAGSVTPLQLLAELIIALFYVISIHADEEEVGTSSPRAPPSPQPGAHLALGTANVLLLPCQEVLASLSYSLITIQRVAQRELANCPSRVGRRQESDFAPKPLCFGTSSLLENFPSRASGKKGFFPFFWTRSDLTVFPQHGSWQNVLIRRLRLQEM